MKKVISVILVTDAQISAFHSKPTYLILDIFQKIQEEAQEIKEKME